MESFLEVLNMKQYLSFVSFNRSSTQSHAYCNLHSNLKSKPTSLSAFSLNYSQTFIICTSIIRCFETKI